MWEKLITTQSNQLNKIKNEAILLDYFLFLYQEIGACHLNSQFAGLFGYIDGKVFKFDSFFFWFIHMLEFIYFFKTI
jgi:hypothetical protein